VYDIEALRGMEKVLKQRLDEVAAEIQKDLSAVQEAIRVAEKMNRLELTPKLTTEKSLNDITQKTPLIEAIRIVMAEKPEKWWRGVDVAGRLREVGYERYGDNLAPNISNTLKQYSLPTDKRPAYFETKQKGKSPVYRPLK